MFGEPLNPPTLTCAESTATIIKSWLIDEKKTRSGLLGVNDALQIVSVRTFQHGPTKRALGMALVEAAGANATGVVAYDVAEDVSLSSFDTSLIRRFARICEDLDVTLLDVMTYSSDAPKGWRSARQQSLF